MTHEIVAKLTKHLSSLPLTREADAVYLLAETRKMFELEHPTLAQAFPTLEFYCCWALHSTLDRKAAQAFLAGVEPILTLQGNHTQGDHERFDRLLTLQAFRDEFQAFLTRNGIDSTICDDAGHWNAFLDAYSRVVTNCELVLKGNPRPGGPLNLAVETVSIRPAVGYTRSSGRPFPMEWVITYVDGRQGQLSLSTHGLLGATVTILGPTPAAVLVHA